jgi:hypothetical protein
LGRRDTIETRHDAKLMATLVDSWLMRVEAHSRRPIDVDLTDPVIQAISSTTDFDGRDFWLVESPWGRRTPPQGRLRNALRRWRKARRRKTWNALLSSAEREVP